MKSAQSEWTKEFQDFLQTEEIAPPRHLSDQIISRIQTDLNPSPWSVFSKLALIHALTGTITLLFCPQFGFSLFDGMGLMQLFMKYGEQACMVGCGAVFMGGSSLLASLVLGPEEIRVLRSKELLQISALGLLSMGILICAGTGVVLEMLFLWLAGSVLGGIATFEIGWQIRKRVLSH